MSEQSDKKKSDNEIEALLLFCQRSIDPGPKNQAACLSPELYDAEST